MTINKNLITDHGGLKYFKNKKNLFFLNGFCIIDKIPLDSFIVKNSLKTHWKNRKQVFKKYHYLKKTNEKVFKYLIKRLNNLHNKKEGELYWRIIIFPWICYYVAILYDRWETISLLKKKKNQKYFTYEYKDKNKFLEIDNTDEWVKKIQTAIFNNNIFLKIIKFRKIENVKIVKKISIKKEIEKKNFSKFISSYLDRLGLHLNWLYFDKFKINVFSLIKLCIFFLQMPSKNHTTFENININSDYNVKKRSFLKTANSKEKNFENFLYSEIHNYLPKTFLENFGIFESRFKKFFKKKRIILGMYSAHLSDYFKIFLAESKLNGSKYIHSYHGAGIHGLEKYDTLHNYYSDISDKIIVASKKLTNDKKNFYLGYDIFKKLNYSFKNKKKLLINYHELLRYELRPPVTTLPFSTELTNFNSILESLKNLNKNLKQDLKYRPKENAGLDSSKRFSKIFGAQFLENPKSLSYYNSIKESKLIICFIPQTSFIEPLYANIPTILVGNNYGFFDNKERRKLLLQMKNDKLFFDNTKEAVKFLNKNWGNIENWWNKSGTQKIRKKILNFYYSPEKDFSKKLFNLIKTEKRSLVN